MTQRTINLYDGLEVLYYFDTDYWDGGANEISDQSGHGRHATASGGPTIGVEGPNDFSAASLDGGDDLFDVGVALPADKQTVAVLAKHDDTSSDADPLMDGTDGNAGYRLYSYSNYIYWRVVDGDGTESYVNVVGAVTSDEWQLFIGLYDGESSKVIVDGELLDSISLSTHTQSNVNTRIGNNNSNNWFNGDIAAAGRWSRALSWTEIQYLNNLTAPRRALL